MDKAHFGDGASVSLKSRTTHPPYQERKRETPTQNVSNLLEEPFLTGFLSHSVYLLCFLTSQINDGFVRADRFTN